MQLEIHNLVVANMNNQTRICSKASLNELGVQLSHTDTQTITLTQALMNQSLLNQRTRTNLEWLFELVDGTSAST